MANENQSPIFMTQRRRILEAYKDAGEPFSASTKPYKSNVTFAFQGADTITASSVRWLVARQGQILEWFSFKIGDPVPGNIDNVSLGYRAATEDDTNLSKARTTNGAEDFIIEGMSCTNRGIRINYLDGVGAGSYVSDVSDPDVVGSLQGQVPIYDPGALYSPPQVQSPFNLENGLYRALAPLVSVEFEWDRSKVVKIGTLEQLPEGAANSYLRAGGEPSTNDRYRIPEGYLWRREGQPDSEFITRGRLNEPLAVPVLSVFLPASVTPVVANIGRVLLDVVVRLHGLSVKLPTRN
jgi:hypothetical protein